MELVSEWLEYDGPSGSVTAYVARPRAASGPLPGVIVIQEIWGVDEHIADLAERFATAGYVALAPDLFSAGGGRPPILAPERVARAKQFLNTIPPPEWGSVLGDEARRQEALSKLPDGEGQQVGETLGAIFGGPARDMDAHTANLRAAVAFLRSHPACEGRAVASVGYCMGGGLSGRLACEEPELAAAAIYYGQAPEPEQVARTGCPVRGFYGEDDERITSGVPAFESALSEAGVEHELRVYPDTGHAFFNDTRPSYRQEAARDAWGRTLQFFAQTLDPVRAAALA